MPEPRAAARPVQKTGIPHLARLCLAAGGFIAFFPASSVTAQPGVIRGQVVDSVSLRGVAGAMIELSGDARRIVADGAGYFQQDSVAAGRRTLTVHHVGYGTRSLEVDVAAVDTTWLRLVLVDSVMVLAPLDVTSLSAAQRQVRALGYRRNVVTREQLAQVRNSSLTFGEVLRQFVPGVRVRTAEGVVGAAVCIELRASPPGSNRCLAPAVYVDGVPITNVATIYAAFPLEMIESIEVVPAAEAGGRFGTGALYGALLIETRRPGARAAVISAGAVRSPFHDWSVEPRGHATLRSFAGATAGNGAGLAGGLAIATSCIGTRPPAHDRLVSSCDAWTTIGATLAAVAIPAVGGALGAGLGGRSRQSSGRVLPGVVGAMMALIPGYALVLTGQRLDSEPLRVTGVTALVVVSPFLSTMADYQFRTVRPPGADRPEE
jgi:hypothetical protein